MAELDNLQNSLKIIIEIRSRASALWKSVAEGMTSRHGDKDKEKSYMSELTLMLDTVGSKIKELETSVNQPQRSIPLPLGHCLYLNTDASNEYVALYSSLVTEYKWLDKAHDYAGGAASLLSHNSLNRSYGKITKSRKRPTEPHTAPPSALDQLINQMRRLYGDMSFQVTRPNGTNSNAIVEVTLENLLTASVIFRGLMIEWVMVRAYGEKVNPSNDGIPDVWRESSYQVFKRITDNANAARLNFYTPLYPDLAVRSFLTYLHSFVNIFTDKCRKCNHHLHNNIPPTWREFKTLDPYHEDCRP